MLIVSLVLAQLATAPPPVRFELPNGLRVWVQEDHTRPVALVQVTYKVGSLHEGPGTTGIAHYVEHMVYRATENIRNEDVYGYIDRIGGRYTGGTWPDVTRYAETVPSWALESALRVTAERMSRARFDSLEFERERNNVVTEANGFADTDPVNVFLDAVLATSFELHPYRFTSNSWARDNLLLTRREAYIWYRDHYGPNNAVLVVVGDVAVDSVRALVEKHFAPLPRAPRSGAIDVVEPPQVAEKRVTMGYAGTRTRMEILYRAPPAAHRDYPVLVAVHRLLAPALARVGREMGAEISARDTATPYPHLFRISVAADSSARLDAILAAIDQEIQLLKTGDVDARLAAARTATAAPARAGVTETQNANFPARQSSLTRTADRLYAREHFPWDIAPETLDSIRAASLRVSAADVRAYVDRWLSASSRTIGQLVPSADGYRSQVLDVPALTTPPAKRLRPDPVPARALQPLGPIAIERARRLLPNGIPIRSARVAGPATTLRVMVDYGPFTDTVVRRFATEASDSAFRTIVTELRAKIAVSRAASDTSASAIARARVVAAVTPSHAAAFSAPRLTVSVAGPRAAERLLDDAAGHFAALARTHREEGGGRREENFARAAILRVPVAAEKQVSIVGGLPGVPRGHPDRLALELLSYIVGVPWYGGRLGWALTKSGLTYSSAATANFGARSGQILFTTQCDTRNTESTIQAITEVIAGVGDAGVTEWELREAQAFTLGRTLLYGPRAESSADLVAAALSTSEDAGLDVLDLPALSRAHLAVTLADVNRVARTYYRPDRLVIAAVGALPASAQPRVFPEGTFRALFEP
jgi:zinc protease